MHLRTGKMGQTFVLALATDKKIGVFNTMLRYYEIGTGISWQTQRLNALYYFKKFIRTILPSHSVTDKPVLLSNDSYISWLPALQLRIKKLIKHYIFYYHIQTLMPM